MGKQKNRDFDKCGAITKSTQKPCELAAGWGTDHVGFGNCKRHLGNTPNGIKAAQKKMAAAAVVTYGLPREIEPGAALLEEIWRTAGHVDWLEGKVRETEDADLVWGITMDKFGGKDAGVTSEAKPSVWLELYRKERSHLVDVCRIAIAAGIAERQVRLAEQQGKIIAQVIRGTLSDIGVKDTPKVAKAVRKNLMLVSNTRDQ